MLVYVCACGSLYEVDSFSGGICVCGRNVNIEETGLRFVEVVA